MNLVTENQPKDQYNRAGEAAQEFGAESSSAGEETEGARDSISVLDLAARGWIALDIPAGVRVPEELPPTRTVRTPSAVHYLIYADGRGEPDCDIYDDALNITTTVGSVLAPPSPGYVWEPGTPEVPVPLPLAVAGRLYADADGDLQKPKEKNRFRAAMTDVVEDATLPPITYWDAERLLPHIPGEGCVGYMIGETQNHKTGVAIMLGLNAVEDAGARVLYIAAEGGRGVKTKRLPKAWRARGHDLASLRPHWKTATEYFDLTSVKDRKELVEAYQDFAPNLIFGDVMGLMAGGQNINEPEGATALRIGAEDLSRRFGGATVVLLHHPNKQGMKDAKSDTASGSGPASYYQLAFFSHDVRYDKKKGVARLFVWKMKDEDAKRWVYFKNASFDTKNPLDDGTPVIRRMTEEETRAYAGKKDGPPPDLDAENSTGPEAIAKIAGDVRRHLKGQKHPTLVRELAEQMIEQDPGHLERYIAGLSEAKDLSLTPDQKRENCKKALIKRLERSIGNDRTPGDLHQFIVKDVNGKLRKPLRFKAEV